jgi:hypothetical protein
MTAFRTILIFSILIAATTDHADAQRRRLNPMNVVYGDVYVITPVLDYGRPAVSYERLFSPRKTLSARIGVIAPSSKSKILVLPLTVQGYTTGGKQHHIEYGGGVMPAIDYYDKENIRYTFYPAILAGYRYQKGTGVVIRATANIIIHDGVYINPSLSVGYQFISH